ncbi:hypothetical protein BZG36_04751 [Bifiguratus adelaidae]|uniref:PAS domain-containing protein n=1 Tax=Bifiguratus adelaidae TaxID=1938954 RepID=A0A261XV23_9FUNG|nr:hypothetical protein BZG36_04751 [Bifiguratus adelaidae]
MDLTFISFHDLTPAGTYLFLSESITDVLGWAPEELVGVSPYTLFHPHDLKAVQQVHLAALHQNIVGNLVYVRMRHKDGRYIDVESNVNMCYDTITTATSLRDRTGNRAKIRAATAEMVWEVAEDGSLRKLSCYRDATYVMPTLEPFIWDPATLKPEPRACLILNRFTLSYTVVYCSKSTATLLNTPASDVLGQSFLDMVHQDDQENVRSQIDIAKTLDAIAHVKFRVRQDTCDERDTRPELPSRHRYPLRSMTRPSMSIHRLLINIEAVVNCTRDGLVIVLRRE